jgi:hypothetical protein
VCRTTKFKKYTIERYGVATSLYFECEKCQNKTSCRADLTTELEAKWASKPPGKKFKDAKKDAVNGADFQLNKKLYLATQQCGGGRTEAKVFAGLLGLHTSVLKGRWREIADTVGLKIIELGQEICEVNVAIEMELSPMDLDTKR